MLLLPCLSPGFRQKDLCAHDDVINRYLATQVLMGLGIATVVLLPLFGFLDLLDQLDDVGKGTYRVQDAFLHTAFFCHADLFSLRLLLRCWETSSPWGGSRLGRS